MKSTETLCGGLASAGFCFLLWGCQVGEPTFMGGPCPEPAVNGLALMSEPADAEMVRRGAADVAESQPEFVPYDTPPTLLNRSDMADLLNCFYPQELRDDKVGGRAELWIYVAEDGSVASSQVKTSSGHAQLDQAAVSVGYFMYFEPARDEGEPRGVWVSQWITFEVR